MARLLGKKALITGGTSGIGLETARQFLSEGAEVVVTGRSAKGIDDVRREFGDRILAIESEAGSVAAQAQLAETLGRHWASIDVVFVNAGDVTHRPLAGWDEATFDRLLSTNLKGPFFLLQALLPLLANPSSIILCGSVSAHIGLPQSSAYAASKAGILSLARTLSGELKDRGIRVNGLSPGPTETPALSRLGLDEGAEEALKQEIRQLVPIGRMGRPIEVAKAAVFLASDESSFVVGTELLVDGGVGSL